MDKTRVGIIGAGIIAPIHEAGYQEMPKECQVVAICDIDEELASQQAGMFDARIYGDYRDLLADPEIDLVDVLLPHHLHHPVAMAVLDAGKHLFLEKPVAVTYQQSMEILNKARQSGLYFGVAENTRYIKAYQEAERCISSGRLGEIQLVRTFLPANERIRLSTEDFWGRRLEMGGGTLIDSGPHTFYLLKWLFGEIRELTAFTSQLYDIGSEVEDNADVRGRLANGADFLCSFTFTAEIPHSERLEIYGRQGSLIIDQLANPVMKTFSDPTDYDGTPVEDIPYDPMGWHYFSIVDEVKDFIHTLRAGQPPTVDPLDCCYAVHVIGKAYESVRLGSQPVRVTIA